MSDLFLRAAIDVQVLAPCMPGFREFDRTLPYRVTRYPVPGVWGQGKLPQVPLAMWAAYLVVRHRPTIVFSDQVQTGGVGLALSLMTGASHVVFAHGLELSPSRLFRVKRTVYSHSAAVLASSRFTKQALISVYGVPPEVVHVSRPGVDANRFVPRPDRFGHRAIMGFHPSDFILLTVGRLDASQRYKGFDRLIRLMGCLLPEFPALRLLIVGGGDDHDRLQALASSTGVAARLTFAGRVSDEHLPSLYQVADLFVFPSGTTEEDPFSVEGYGIALAEAAASGLPSVAYRLGGVGDVIEDGVTGILSKPDEGAFTAAVRNLITQPERRIRMGQAARQRALRELGWDAAVATLRDLCTRLAGPTFRNTGFRHRPAPPTTSVRS